MLRIASIVVLVAALQACTFGPDTELALVVDSNDPAVVEQAAKAVESLHFQHAFDPLSRIVREAAQPNVRASALRALARIDTMEAAEFLLGVLEHGAPADRTAALEALKRVRGARFVELARSALHTTTPEVQTALREVLRQRGIAA
jgi:HEAT repeat protein